MTGLEQTFYIMGIIFMSVMFLMVLTLVIAVLVIRKKINRINENIQTKLSSVTALAEQSGELSALASKAVVNSAKKVLKKNKK